MRKVNSTLREILAEEIEKLNDPSLELVSVTAVDTAPNLRQATVYIDVLQREQEEPAILSLRKASRRLQSAIGAQVRMKFTPMLEFRMDEGVIEGARIDALLREIGSGQREEEE
jgi:ribosome-binding factor A